MKAQRFFHRTGFLMRLPQSNMLSPETYRHPPPRVQEIGAHDAESLGARNVAIPP